MCHIAFVVSLAVSGVAGGIILANFACVFVGLAILNSSLSVYYDGLGSFKTLSALVLAWRLSWGASLYSALGHLLLITLSLSDAGTSQTCRY